MPRPDEEFEDDVLCLTCGHPLRHHFVVVPAEDEKAPSAYWHGSPCEVNDEDGKCKCKDFA